MVFIRRSVAGLLTLALLPVLLITLVAFRINATFTDPDFYVEELRAAEVYAFLYDDLLPEAIVEAAASMSQLPLGVEITSEDLAAAVSQIAPRDWTQTQVERAIGDLVPYATGEVEDFRIVVPLQERGQTALGVFMVLAQGQAGNIYARIFDELVPMAIDKRLQGQDDLPLGVKLTGTEIGEALKEITPPDWARKQVGKVIDEIGPYLIGQSDGFQIAIPLIERPESALQVVKRLGQGQATHIHANLFAELIPKAVDERLAQQGQLPFGLDLTGAEIGAAFKEVASVDWIRLQNDLVLDGVGPYLIGQQDGFAVTIPLAEHAEVSLEVIRELLSEADLRDFLFKGFIAPAVASNFGGSVELAEGVTITQREILDTMAWAITEEWLIRQIQVILTSAGPYLIGQQGGFQANISLAAPKDAAAGAIANLGERKLVELYRTYPACALAESPPQLLAIAGGQLPTCLPPGVSTTEILALVDTEALVDVAIRSQLPDAIVLTEADLRGALDEENLVLLDRTREIVSQGWTFTHEDLRKRLNPNASDFLKQVREVSNAGWTFTDVDLRQRLLDAGQQEAVGRLETVRQRIGQGFTYTQADLREQLQTYPGALGNLDRFRENARQARQGRYLSFLLIGALVGGAGLLGGRGWPGRTAWAAGALATAALVIYVAGGPGAANGFDTGFETLRIQAQQGKEGVSLLATGKALELMENVARDFRAAVTGKALTVFLVGASLSGVAVAWHLLARRRSLAQPSLEA